VAFQVAFEQLKLGHRVAPAATGIPIRHNSVLFKLSNAKQHLDALLSTEEWVVPTLSNATSGAPVATSSAGGSIPPAQISPTAYHISGNMDDFFGNLASAFDFFSQIVNLAYFASPLNESIVDLNVIVREMKTRRPSESMTTQLSSLRRQRWYVSLNLYRRCATHRKIIQCQVITSQSLTQTSPYALMRIVLPDNPFDDRPTYHMNRDVVFVKTIFINAIGSLDQLFHTLESRIKTANQIPV